jgi:hypothetical protein
VNKTKLEFFKIGEAGLLDNSESPGRWASDDLMAANNTWTVNIPSDIAAGNYVLRHEIIALHNAMRDNGAQAYPQCINLKVIGDGTATPKGISATQFYKPTDPGILVDIFSNLRAYTIPGPSLYNGGDAAPTSTVVTPTGASSTAVYSTGAAQGCEYGSGQSSPYTSAPVTTDPTWASYKRQPSCGRQNRHVYRGFDSKKISAGWTVRGSRHARDLRV